jgi:hypothetical protein
VDPARSFDNILPIELTIRCCAIIEGSVDRFDSMRAFAKVVESDSFAGTTAGRLSTRRRGFLKHHHALAGLPT